MHRGQVSPDLDLVIAIGGKDIGEAPRSFIWEARNKLGLFFQERTRPEQVYRVALEAGFEECFARVERSTATDTVISCEGEKSIVYPQRKFVYDVAARRLVTYSSYQPVAMRWSFARAGGAVTVGSATEQTLAMDFRPGRNPEFQMAEAEALRLADQVPEQVANDLLKSYALPTSTLEQLLAARPSQAVNFPANQPEFNDSIGPWQLVGDQVWFGKTFYDGEGHTGVGGFGYFDRKSRTYRIFAPPEIADWSVSAILVETDAVWLALVHRGEWGDSGGGALRYDRRSGSVRKFESPDLIRQFLRVGDRLLLTTNHGVGVIYNGQLRRYFADQWKAGSGG